MTSVALAPTPRRAAATVATAVEIVVPVHNEEAGLERSIRRLHRFLSDGFPFTWRIVIADNASTDATPVIARRLGAELRGVDVLRLERKGRGRALRTAWAASDARVVAYMDVDLSTDLRALSPLVAPLVSGHSHVSIGTRLAHGARVVRGPKRELTRAPTTGSSTRRCARASPTLSAASRPCAPMRWVSCSTMSATKSGRIRWAVIDGGGFGGPQDERVGATEVMSAISEVCTAVDSVSGLYDLQGKADALRALAAS